MKIENWYDLKAFLWEMNFWEKATKGQIFLLNDKNRGGIGDEVLDASPFG